MSDSLPKRMEIAFRRFFIRTLRGLTRRSTAPPSEADLPNARILFIRQDMIGDVLVSTPLFALLKKNHPNSTLDAVLSPRNEIALRNNQRIRKRWIYDKTLFGSLRMIREIRKEKYDFAVDLMDNPSATSTAICLLAGARWNVGIDKDNAYVYDIVVPMLSRRETHIIDRLKELLVPFGIQARPEDLRVEFTPSAEGESFAGEWLEELKIREGDFVAVNISAGGEVRYWGNENFRALIERVRHNHPELPVILLSKPSHRPRSLQIARDLPNVHCTPQTTFDQFAALIKRARLLVTPDTSAVHLAAAFDVPSVVLYVQSDPALRIWEPYGTRHIALVTPVDDLTRIPVQEVGDSVERLLEETKGPAAGEK